MPSRTELQGKWSTRLAEWRTLGIHVNGASVASEVLEDLTSSRFPDLRSRQGRADASIRCRHG